MDAAAVAAAAPLPVRAAGEVSSPDVHAAAAHGTSGTPGALPYHDQIQRLFGRHDISGIEAHVGGPAAAGTGAMGAAAFATGHKVAFAVAPDLHTAAHEAAHVVQQRAGVQLAGGVGDSGDVYERHADAVADLVVQGKSAEALLSEHAGVGTAPASAAAGGAVQRTLWKWTDQGRRWVAVRWTDDRRMPPFPGKPGDYWDSDTGARLSEADVARSGMGEGSSSASTRSTPSSKPARDEDSEMSVEDGPPLGSMSMSMSMPMPMPTPPPPPMSMPMSTPTPMSTSFDDAESMSTSSGPFGPRPMPMPMPSAPFGPISMPTPAPMPMPTSSGPLGTKPTPMSSEPFGSMSMPSGPFGPKSQSMSTPMPSWPFGPKSTPRGPTPMSSGPFGSMSMPSGPLGPMSSTPLGSKPGEPGLMETLSSGSWTTSTDGLGAGAGRPTASMPGGSSMQTSAAPSPAEELQAKISKFWSGYSPAGLIPGLLEFLQLRGSSVDKVKVTDSSGSVLTFIIDGVDAVIQHYKDPELFGQLVEKFEHLKKHADTPGVASRVAAIRGIDPKLRNLFVTRVTPLNSLFPPAGRTPEAQAAARQKLSAFVQKNALKILVDCSASIDALAKIGLAQRDVTVDNIGIQGDTFVLFDFNLLAEGTKETVKVDHQSLVRSLRHHGWKDAPAIEHHGELQEICDEEAMAGLKIDLTVR